MPATVYTKRKETCRKNGRPLWFPYALIYPHGYATHDFTILRNATTML